MFKYKKSLKVVNYIEEVINSIRNNEKNSGYRVEINYGNGKLYEDKVNTYDVDVYVTKNYKNYNRKGMTMRIVDNIPLENDYRLPCKIIGDPIKSKGIIKNIEFNKENILKVLKANKKYIDNERLGTIIVPNKDKSFTVEQIYSQNITVYFEQ